MKSGWTLVLIGSLCLSGVIQIEAVTTTTIAPAAQGTSGVPGAVPGSCTDTFTQNVNMNRPNGQLQSGITTSAACQAACLALSFDACAGFDFGSSACYIHTSTNVGATSLGTLNGNTYNARVPCTGTTATGGCVDTFTDTTGSGISGGSLQSGNFPDLGSCKTACLAVAATVCAALDYNTRDRQCYFHSPGNVLIGQRTTDPLVMNSARVSCDGTTTQMAPTGSTPCVDTFDRTQNMNFQGGMLLATANTITECNDACLAQATCTGFDYNNNAGTGQRCFWFSLTNFPASQSAPGVDHYRRRSCVNATSTRCTDTFTAMPNMQLFDGTDRGVQSRAACESVCLSLPTCTQYEIDPNGRCWIHFNNTNQPVAITPPNGHVLYVRVSCTPSGTATGPCSDTFTERQNVFYYGAVPNSATTTVACATTCLDQAQPPCVGYDFSTTQNRCYLHTQQTLTSNFNPTNGNTGTGVSHFRRNFDCNGTTISPVCRDEFVVTQNMNRPGGSSTTIRTRVGCEDECLRTTQTDANACQGYDFNVNENTCFLHLNTLPATNNANGVNTYERRFTCSASTILSDSCTDTFEVFPNSNVFGGARVATANTNEECRQVCLRTRPGDANFCFGYDFNGGCFLHTTAANYTINMNAQGVTHYRRNNVCASPTGSDNCVEQYNSTANRNVNGGISVGQQSVEQCMRICANRTTTCYGLDYSGNSCWVLETENYQLNPGTSPGVTNYRRLFNCVGGSTTVVQAGCRPTYTLSANQQVFGGVLAASGTTVETCADACNAETSCTGYNYDRVAPTEKCYLFTTSLRVTTSNNDIDLYTKDNNCDNVGSTTSSSSSCEMRLVGPGNVPGGQRVTNANTLEACRTYCLDTTACMAIDWDKEQNRCFWFSVSGSTPAPKACCDHYNKVCTGSCVETYNITRNTYFPGGMEVPNRPTPAECTAACNEREACDGFDFNTAANLCYLHMDSNFNNRQSGSGADHYRRVRCTDSARSTTMPTTMRTTLCPVLYTLNANRNALGGFFRPNLRSLDACQAGCTSNSTCGAVDFDPSTNGCYFHGTNPTLRNAPGVNHYTKVPCSVTPAPATPAPATPAPATPAPLTCNTDVAFLLDISQFDGPTQTAYINMMRNVMNGLRIGTTGDSVQAYGRSFGQTASFDIFRSATSRTRDALLNAASNGGLFGIPGTPNLQQGIQDYLVSDLPRSPGRNVVLVTASRFNTPQIPPISQPVLTQLTTRQPPITVVTVGNDNTANLNIIRDAFRAQIPPASYTPLPIQSGQTVNSILSQFPQVCRGQAPAPTAAPINPLCSGDVAVLFDDSGSIRDQITNPDNWQVLRDFVGALIRRFDPSNTDTRIALVKFSTTIDQIHGFNQLQNTQFIETRLNQAQYTGGETRLVAALELLRDQTFTPLGGDRPNIQNILVVVTDGMPTQTTNAQLEAVIRSFPAASRPIIIPVGVTDQVDQATLNILANTSAQPGNVIPPITVANFGQLANVVGNIVSTSCNAARR